jgi:molybdopterin-guanine dinucleotide biosynthesis protein A
MPGRNATGMIRKNETIMSAPNGKVELPTRTCVIAVGGYSGSGKTTLIEKALEELRGEGLYVGVLKHTSHHSLDIDKEGKDTDRFFKAGAERVLACDSHQGFARFPMAGADLNGALDLFPSGLDLILIEGFRGCSIPGIWIEKDRGDTGSVPERPPCRKVLFRNDRGYLEEFIGYIRSKLARFHGARPLRAGILVGGRSRRMGRPKALLEMKGGTLIEKTFGTLSSVVGETALLGAGDVPDLMKMTPRLPDVPGVAGPMAGMLAAFRWDPKSAWIVSAVDLPLMEERAWDWLLRQRRPGVWAVLPRLGNTLPAETTAGCYEPMIYDYVEALASRGSMKLQEVARHPKVLTPLVPDAIAHAWQNVNTIEEWKRTLSLRKDIF